MTEAEDLSFEATPDPDKDKVKNLFQKLSEIQLSIGYIQKRGEHIRFRYTRAIDILKELRVEMASRNVVCGPSCIESVERDTGKKTKSGNPIARTILKFTFEFINGDNPNDRYERDWYGYGEGDDHLAAYGAMTGAQRHFYEKFFHLLTDVTDPEKWSADQEALDAKERARESHRASSRMTSTKVGGVGHTPTKEELEDSDPDNVHQPDPPKPLDESWRHFPVKMCQGLEQRYKGKCVGDIHLKHLIGAFKVFVSNVHNRVVGYDAPGHQQLANALVARVLWEIAQGNIIESVNLDGTYQHEIVKH
jgi:hypothetical protein